MSDIACSIFTNAKTSMLSSPASSEEALRVLDALQTDELCPCERHGAKEHVHEVVRIAAVIYPVALTLDVPPAAGAAA